MTLHLSNENYTYAISNDYTCITMSENFNQPIKLPKSITALSLGHRFNQELKLPKKLKFLNIGSGFKGKIKLPKKLKNMYVDYYYYSDRVIKIPKNIESLILFRDHLDMFKIPKNLERISDNGRFIFQQSKK